MTDLIWIAALLGLAITGFGLVALLGDGGQGAQR